MTVRIGVHCAVIDDAGAVLLSQREDLRVWNLPGGRLDPDETLAMCAAREVFEETGVIVHVERPIGLYVWAGRQHLNLVYAAIPIGGKLKQATPETLANRYFPPVNVPPMPPPMRIMVEDATGESSGSARLLQLSPGMRLLLALALRLRWMRNWLRGQPESPYPQFEVTAAALLWDEAHRRLVTLKGESGLSLPRIACDGKTAPWEQLKAVLQSPGLLVPALRWVGVWQDAPRGCLELVFAATLPTVDLTGHAEWVTARNAALPDRDTVYIDRVKSTYRHDPVWAIYHQADIQMGDTLTL
jgi:ADP-ribose pyrophosphatase YjhB (NUDIX family)